MGSDVQQTTAGLSRRDFLRTGTLGGVAALSAPGMLRGDVALRDSAVKAFQASAFELEEATIAQLQEWMDAGRYTARRLVELYLGRIEELDRQGPMLRHVIETNPQALEIAERLDAERKQRRLRGPLHGVPVLVKDNIDTADRMTTTAGSLALEGSVPTRDSFVAERLRAAGAILLGKANLSEWANFRSTHSSSGWSGRGGQGRNPYALDRTPCGSSSGTGGGIAASYAAVGVGTETDGSVTCPSSVNSLVGIKPTLGLISRAGIVPIAHSQDTAGPMARTVRDAAILLGALAGIDPRDEATAAARGHIAPDYTRFLDAAGLAGARIGVPRKHFFGYSEEADRVAEEALGVLRDGGAVLIDPAELPNAGDYGDSEFTVLLYEFKADLNRYLASLGPAAPIRTLADAIAFNTSHSDREMPYFGQEILEMAEEKGPLTEKEYLDALDKDRRLAGKEGIDAVMGEHRLDALVMPTGGPAWPIDLVNGDAGGGSATTPPAVAGYPHITVPAGYSFGLPIGLSFIGRAWSEPTLLRLGFAFEQATNARKPPGFRPAADVSFG